MILTHEEKLNLMRSLNWDYLDTHIARRIWPKERRYHFDFALAVLRREPLPLQDGVMNTISNYKNNSFIYPNDFANLRSGRCYHLTKKPEWQEFRNDIERIVYEMMSGETCVPERN